MNGWKGRFASALPSSVWKTAYSSYSLLNQFLTSNTRKSVPLLHEAETIEDIRQITSERIRALLHDAGISFTEDHASGRRRFNIPNDSITDVANRILPSGMVLELHKISNTLELSIFADSLRKNLARATCIPVVAASSGDPAKSTFTNPIDVVYTWVDSQDPQWQKDYDEALSLFGSASPRTSSDIVRFQDRDELKYSLRSLEMFAPWVNHIHIVTNGQVPSWINLDNPKISIVSHADIFEDPRDLPTFNSHAIEANLHRVPGLSEHFLYFNDDVFLADYCYPETFFTSSGKSKYFESESIVPADFSVTDLPSNWAAYNNKQLLEENFGYIVSKKFKHTAHPQRLSTLKNASQVFKKHLKETSEKKFRQRTDIALPSNLAHHFGAISGTAVPAEIDYRYVDISSARADVELSRLLIWDNPTMFCLNQVSSKIGPDESAVELIQRFLKNYFPWKSSAEL